MTTRKIVIISVLAALAVFRIGHGIHQKMQAAPVLAEPVRGGLESPARAPLQAASATASTPAPSRYAPVLLSRPGNLESVRQAFPHMKDDRLADGRKFITFDADSAARLAQGDVFALSVPGEAGAFTARIDAVSTFEGMRRWTGRFVGTDTEPNEFSLTLSADNQYAAGYFVHGELAFVMEAKDGAGWFNHTATESQHLMSEEF